MADERAELVDLQMLGPAAQRAVAAARSAARTLGHPRIGTEHLLLGILADVDTEATQALGAAGASQAAVRSKVRELKGPVAGAPEPSAADGTPRAARAVGRSARFARRRHHEAVTPEDLLIGVLDVEGTAGQILRSLGVDLDDVRKRLDGGTPASDAADDATPSETSERVGRDDGPPPARCPVCDVVLGQLTHQRALSTGAAGPIEVLLHSCPACETLLGLTPA